MRSFAKWYGLCTLLPLSGCFYFLPVEVPVGNQPPQIAVPESNPATLTIRGDTVTLTVMARDPDPEDTIEFLWSDLDGVPHEQHDYAAQDGLMASSVTVTDVRALRSSQVRCVVLDNEGHTTMARWNLVAQ